MSNKPVLSKTDFCDRYIKDEFGNHSPTWPTLEAFLEAGGSSMEGLFHIRNIIVNGPTYYNIHAKGVASWHRALIVEQGVDPKNLYISAMCPTHKTILNAEVMDRIDGGPGLDLFYSTVPKPMRDSLREGGTRAQGLTASEILKHYCNTNSYEWLMYLLEKYPSHVIEFTALSCEWGTVPGQNVCFWECRAGY